MGLILRGQVWNYDFRRNNKRYQGSTGTIDRVKAELVLKQIMESVGAEWRPNKKVGVEPGVYFVKSPSTGLIKVGCSGELTRRLSTLSSHGPERLHLVALLPTVEYEKAEAVFHEFLAEYRKNGEWFEITSLHVEAAILYWATGHPVLETRAAIRALRASPSNDPGPEADAARAYADSVVFGDEVSK